VVGGQLQRGETGVTHYARIWREYRLWLVNFLLKT